jgi:hypothetical protein
MRLLFLPILVVLLAIRIVPAHAQQQSNSSSSTETALPAPSEIKAAIEAESTTVGRIWPGYWPDHEVGAQFVDGRNSSRLSSFHVYAHEAFHAYQDSTFNGFTDSGRSVDIEGFGPVLPNSGILENPDFLARVEVERRLLHKAARETNSEELGSLMKSYLVVRLKRYELYPSVEEIERNLEWKEGTADFIGCSVATVATNSSFEREAECLTRVLDTESNSSILADRPRIMRWRLYSTGATLCAALERLSAENWKARVEGGIDLIDVLAQTLNMERRPNSPRVEKVLGENNFKRIKMDFRQPESQK